MSGYVPKPIIPQQTWGNSMSQAIQRERMMQHERKLIEQEMEYKKTRDVVNDQKWNKEFDIRAATAKTHNDILKENAVRSAKRNEQLEMELDRMRTQQINLEKQGDLRGYMAKDAMEQKKYQDKIDVLKQQASQWGGREASDELARMRQESGLSPKGSGGGWWDYMLGVGKNENQGLARAQKESQPGYVNRKQFVSNMIDDMGGAITPETYKLIMGQSFNQANQAASMPNAAAINYVNQANMPRQGTVQQMYQNAQPSILSPGAMQQQATVPTTMLSPQQQAEMKRQAQIKKAMNFAFPGGYGFYR